MFKIFIFLFKNYKNRKVCPFLHSYQFLLFVLISQMSLNFLRKSTRKQWRVSDASKPRGSNRGKRSVSGVELPPSSTSWRAISNFHRARIVSNSNPRKILCKKPLEKPLRASMLVKVEFRLNLPANLFQISLATL